MVYTQIIKLCKESEKNITAVLEDLNMSKGNISNWRNGGYPSAEVLIKIADYFDVSVDYLLGRTNNPQINK